MSGVGELVSVVGGSPAAIIDVVSRIAVSMSAFVDMMSGIAQSMIVTHLPAQHDACQGARNFA